MTSMLRNSMLAAAIFAVPLAASAQSNNPTANLGSNKSVTAAPQTADSQSSTMRTGDANATPPAHSTAAQNPHIAGATGKTVVPGTTSTVAGDRPSTANAKTGSSTASDGGSGK
jgi:hypothetical protein